MNKTKIKYILPLLAFMIRESSAMNFLKLVFNRKSPASIISCQDPFEMWLKKATQVKNDTDAIKGYIANKHRVLDDQVEELRKHVNVADKAFKAEGFELNISENGHFNIRSSDRKEYQVSSFDKDLAKLPGFNVPQEQSATYLQFLKLKANYTAEKRKGHKFNLSEALFATKKLEEDTTKDIKKFKDEL
ncbi:hypothetical protein IPH25_01505 [bacterium]|nr:MAG: hypothetical protein IPG37_03635 [bacterium]QQR62103.1 MAG: hypothetical protein IPH25_01505 [bacterium]QQR63340.1 MAG: hypothetical protein IPH67_02615 [bacterium]